MIEKIKYNLAIVGGGRTCSYFLKLLKKESFPFLDIRILGVCDINLKAEGITLAKKMGIFTTDDVQKIFKIEAIDGIIELTNSKSLPELMATRPKRTGVIEHNIGRVLKKLFETSQALIQIREKSIVDERSYEVLLQQANLGIVVIDPNFMIINANKTYLNAVKKLSKDVVGKKCHEVVKGFYAPCHIQKVGFQCPLLKTVETGKSAHLIHEHVLTDEKSEFFNIVTYPVKDENNNVVRIIEIWQDITSQINLKLEKKVQQIEADMKKVIQEDRLVSLGKLVASSVHEINNPIQGLLIFSRIMEDISSQDVLKKEDIEKFREFTHHMSRELERCGNIVSGLLAFSRESALEFLNIDINEILETALSLTGHKIKLTDIELNISIARDPLIVFGDKNQLQQCILNLIFNAIEAMPKGGKLSISSRLNQEMKKIVVEICDNGCGINKDDLDHVFDPFFTTKEAGEGTGLGLSIVHGIIKDHNGGVEVTSSNETGTTFVISFPMVSN